MKKVILSMVALALFSVTSCKTETKKTTEVKVNATMTSFGVRGNCGMCKKTIEAAANNVDGVVAANWSVENKKMNVSFDATKTNQVAIENAISASGYDTESVVSNETAYGNLPGCCQYDHSMEMNQ